ncbi:hypothetical protein B0I35DRAFT_475505 [Stachybotrys elegans]|uniref:Oxidoreductase acuF-like C2H2 type zinc-finger domain-containing protein n=1 Tax=Stachybotrys elegans TaxID=80388 RepID=A0A8K0WUP7_9HYPO|nr:hypothetical protein B0I35DRAFT_475505 [Stachybotrys elegans]
MIETELIDKWLAQAQEDDLSAEPSLVANLYASCSSFYCDVLKALSEKSSVQRSVLVSLQRSQSYLVLWADGVGVGENKFDACLAKSKRVRSATLRLLLSVTKTLTERLLLQLHTDHRSSLTSKAAKLSQIAAQVKEINHQDSSQASDSDGDSDVSSDDGGGDLIDISEDIKTDTQCLLELVSRFQEPTVGITAKESAVKLETLGSWNPAQIFIDRLLQRYPQCEASLAAHLGNASWSQFLHCRQTRTQNIEWQKLEESPLICDAISKPASTMFHDSGLGTSVPTEPLLPAPSDYAETEASYHGGVGGSVRLPPLPNDARKGIPFECIGCGAMISIKTKRAWKKHLFQDLRPYLCLESTCSFKHAPFATRAEWETHMSLDHGDIMRRQGSSCPICLENFPESKIQTSSHLVKHLEQLALTILPATLEIEDEEEGDDSEISSMRGSQGEMPIDAPAIPTLRVTPGQVPVAPRHHFYCVFHYAGCNFEFAYKNDWKRHVSHHLGLTYWLCTTDDCAQYESRQKRHATLPEKGTIFRRRDLFTQHFQRMHYPSDRQYKSAQQDEQLHKLQVEAKRVRCHPPTYMRCPAQNCSMMFDGEGAWDQRMEHVTQHLVAIADDREPSISFGGDDDPTLGNWVEQVGVVKRTNLGWELCNPFSDLTDHTGESILETLLDAQLRDSTPTETLDQLLQSVSWLDN